MNVYTAYAIVGEQERAFKKIKNFILTNGEYDFRVSYKGGFACYTAIDYREANTRKRWKYFGGVSAVHCMRNYDVICACADEIKRKFPNSDVSIRISSK